MFTLEYDRAHGVLMARFSGVFDAVDLQALDAAAIDFLANEGAVDALIDLTAVDSVAAPTSAFVERGRRPQIMAGRKRAIVAQQSLAYGLGRLFAAYQETAGAVPPQVVRTMTEAFELLGIAEPRFEPYPLKAPPL